MGIKETQKKVDKIGELNFKDFKTEFEITKKVKDYLKEEKISLASLIPNGWEWYEVDLFDFIEGNNFKPNIKYGKNFKVTYYGIIEEELGNNDEKEVVNDKRFGDEINENENFLYTSTRSFNNTPKNPSKKFEIKYVVAKN